MSLPYLVHISLEQKDFNRIYRNGFIACDVLLCGTTRPRHFGYCCHCKRLMSLTWAKRHAKSLKNASHDITRHFKPDKSELYRGDIHSELELFFEKGRFSRPSREGQRRGISEGQRGDLGANRNDWNDCSLERCEPVDVHEQAVQGVSPQGRQSHEDEDFEHECASVLDCLLKCSFSHSEFDSEKFLVLADTLMEKVFSHSDDKTTNGVKADIITSLVRILSTLLSLTKTQNEQMLAFWKPMMVFVHPQSRSIVKKVRACYSTCVRVIERRAQEKDGLSEIHG